MSENRVKHAIDPAALSPRMAPAPTSLSKSISGDTTSTLVEPAEACKSNDGVTKYATIVDIDTTNTDPFESLTFQRPSIDDLTKGRGPSKIMEEAKTHKTNLRWIHLRANCMGWVEDVMDKICEEKGIPIHDTHDSSTESSNVTRNPFLRQDLWSKLCHGKESKQVHSRFMRPMCTPFAINVEDEQSDSDESIKQNRDNLVLYLPFLHWESCSAWRERQSLLQAATDRRRTMAHADDEFVKKYLHHRSPLHDRRSLHQAYYYNLGKTENIDGEVDEEAGSQEDSSLRADEQVMQRLTKKNDPSAAKLIVVDQLWLWVIKGSGISGDVNKPTEPDLVITAFPERFNGALDPSANVYKGIVGHLQRGLEPPLKSANDLAALIIEHCTGVFFQRQLGEDLWFLEFFASEIGSVRKRQNKAFKRFCKTSQELTELESQNAPAAETSEKLDELFKIDVETSLTAEITSIIEELNCIDFISSQQQDVLSSLTRAQKSRNFSRRSLRQVCELVKERRDAWAGVEQTARRSYGDLRDQMDLKQKQANVSEARSSRRQAEASTRHGRIILLFTVVTIIFLPMSFMATWFGMNARGINEGSKLGVGVIAAIIFPISITIALFALVLAFSERLRGLVVEVFEGVLDFGFAVTGISGSRRRRRHERSHARMHEMRRFGNRAGV